MSRPSQAREAVTLSRLLAFGKEIEIQRALFDGEFDMAAHLGNLLFGEAKVETEEHCRSSYAWIKPFRPATREPEHALVEERVSWVDLNQ
jgi:hypothetical protein